MLSAMSMTRTVLIVGAALIVGLGLVAALELSSRPPSREREPITYVEDPAVLAGYVALEGPGIATAENFVGHRIRVIGGTVHNVSEVPLRSVELHLTFQSFEGEPVHEFDGDALRAPLGAGEARAYEFRFENLPEDWNLRIPAVELRRVGY